MCPSIPDLLKVIGLCPETPPQPEHHKLAMLYLKMLRIDPSVPLGLQLSCRCYILELLSSLPLLQLVKPRNTAAGLTLVCLPEG